MVVAGRLTAVLLEETRCEKWPHQINKSGSCDQTNLVYDTVVRSLQPWSTRCPMTTCRIALSCIALAAFSGVDRADDPPSPAVANELYTKGEWAEAARLYQMLARQDRTKGQYWYRLGTCRLSLKEYRP